MVEQQLCNGQELCQYGVFISVRIRTAVRTAGSGYQPEGRHVFNTGFGIDVVR
jgi:hypothetical protein